MAIIIKGKNKERIRDTTNTALAIDDIKRGRKRLFSNIFVPCHVLIKASPRQAETEIKNARNIEKGPNPE
jgi:hypothetical protein